MPFIEFQDGDKARLINTSHIVQATHDGDVLIVEYVPAAPGTKSNTRSWTLQGDDAAKALMKLRKIP